jgi:hypothetical protein
MARLPGGGGGRRRDGNFRAAMGMALAILGTAMLLGLVVISNDPSPFCQALLFRLGLGLIAMISATAQGVVIWGLILMWNALKRPAMSRRDPDERG